MEPITTTVAISWVVSYLAKTLKDNKSIHSFFDDFTEATINWLKPIFITNDGQPKDAINDLQQKPDSSARQEAVKSRLAVAVEDNPEVEKLLQEMAKIIQKKEDNITKDSNHTITGHYNKVYDKITSSNISDQSITQSNAGGGDNVVGNKTTNHY